MQLRSMIFSVVCIFACAGTLHGETNQQAVESAVDHVFGECGNPCLITFSPGGVVDDFVAAANAVNEGGKKLVIIDGECASACALFADLARAHVCITQEVSFGFHMERQPLFVFLPDFLDRTFLWAVGLTHQSPFIKTRLYIEPDQSSDIDWWVRKHGGYPTANTKEDLLWMPFRQARAFWRVCPQT